MIQLNPTHAYSDNLVVSDYQELLFYMYSAIMCIEPFQNDITSSRLRYALFNCWQKHSYAYTKLVLEQRLQVHAS